MIRFDSIFIDDSQKEGTIAKKALADTSLKQCSTQKHDFSQLLDYREGKKHLYISEKRGKLLDLCATMNKKYICCNVHVLKSVSNCPYDCSYCFLQNYLNNPSTTIISDTNSIIDEVKEKIAQQPWRFFRIGTWELGDSLALENLTSSSSDLVLAFSNIENAVLELKTKSDCVDPLLNLDHKGRTVVSWSLNPEIVIRREEHRTANLKERLTAMKKIYEAGYLIGLHFDPMIYFDGWESEYNNLIHNIFQIVSPDRIAWISIGSLRFNPEMKKTIEQNFPGSKLTSSEMILGDDRKMRYIKPLRTQMYKQLYKSISWAIKAAIKEKTANTSPFIYLCMERWNMWETIFGSSPSSIENLDYLLTLSLYQRFPGLVLKEPIQSLYESQEIKSN